MAEASSTDRPLDEQVRLEIVDQVAWITIDRPEKGNALSPPCRDRIRDLINEAQRQLRRPRHRADRRR